MTLEIDIISIKYHLTTMFPVTKKKNLILEKRDALNGQPRSRTKMATKSERYPQRLFIKKKIK